MEQNFNTVNFTTSAGIMVNYNTKLENIEFYPGIDLSYRLIKNTKWFASMNRSLRLPTFTDLYYQGAQNIGNPNLKPENAWTFETGLKSKFTGIIASFSWFHRWGNNIIDWIWLNDQQKWHTENWTKLNTNGIEFQFLIDKKILPAAMQFVQSIGISYAFTDISKSSGEFNSYYALDNLKHKLVLNLSHAILKKLSANWTVSYQDRNGTYGKWDDNTKTAFETPYAPFWLLDGKLIYSEKHFTLFIECSNILNTNYIDFGNIEQPGRWLKSGVEIRL
jgi:iron complex outermembrane receptor protein